VMSFPIDTRSRHGCAGRIHSVPGTEIHHVRDADINAEGGDGESRMRWRHDRVCDPSGQDARSGGGCGISPYPWAVSQSGRRSGKWLGGCGGDLGHPASGPRSGPHRARLRRPARWGFLLFTTQPWVARLRREALGLRPGARRAPGPGSRSCGIRSGAGTREGLGGCLTW
jgi:hypothetical protein